MNTTYLKYIILGLASMLIINACEDPIDVELEEAPNLITVDAWINNQPIPQTIRLTESQEYFNSTFTTALTGASVIVSRGDGQEFEFVGDGDGNYIWTPIAEDVLGQVGDEFELIVNINGETLQSNTKLNRVPPIDEITQEFVTDFGFVDGIMVEFISRDPLGPGDTYWIKTYKNGIYLNKAIELNIAYDAGFDSGSQSDGLIFIPPVRFLVNPEEDTDPTDSIDIPQWEPGDNVKIEIHSISNDAFSFLETTRDQLLNSQNGIFAEPLANTKGNVNNTTSGTTVLGVFNVAAISEKEAIIE